MESVDSTGSKPSQTPAPSDSPIARALTPWLGFAIAALGIIWASGLIVDFGGTIIVEQVMCAVLGHSLAIAYLNVPAGGGKRLGPLPWYDALFALIGFCVGWYMFFRFPFLLQNVFYVPVEANIVGGALVLLTAEALRRTAGWGIFSVLLVFVAYGLFGHLIPGQLQGRSLDPAKFFSFLGIDQTSLLGLPLNIITTIVIVFIFLGQALLRSGGSTFITDISSAAMGGTRGGSAKIAVVASGLFGSISGSAVSNVASTGVLTIPLMRRGGYSRPVAGAIEAVASTGGQIMPPIMGAAAFLMAELLEIEYREIIVAALLPALLYYVAVFLQADLEAGRLGISPLPKDQIPPGRRVMKEGWYFAVPFIVLLGALFVLNSPPEKAALFGALAIVALGLLLTYQGSKLTLRSVMECLKRAGEASADIVIIGGGAGIILGIIDATGLSFGLALILVEVGQHNLVLLLVLTAVVSVILGMGMPTTAIYFLLAVLVAPPMVELGVTPIAAHLFVLYFGLMSMISPPVALAAFVAAKIADAGPMRTAFAACRFGWPAFVVPFLFVAAPNLIMNGDAFDIIVAFGTAVAGIWIASAAITGYFLISLNPALRVVYLVGGLSLLVPSQAFEAAGTLQIVGAVLSAAGLALELNQRRRLAGA